jgi:hypothetical protein
MPVLKEATRATMHHVVTIIHVIVVVRRDTTIAAVAATRVALKDALRQQLVKAMKHVL